MNEINKEINYSTIQPDSFSFAKSRDLKHIKASEMKVVKGKMVKETACGRNLVIPIEHTNQIKETNKEVNVNNNLSKFCLNVLSQSVFLNLSEEIKLKTNFQKVMRY